MTRLLLVCTANRCRSPIAEAFVDLHLPSNSVVEATSAGLLPGGEPVPGPGIELMRRFGIDLSAHRSRQVTADDLMTADLVLTMTRSHARSLVAQRPAAWLRCFTLKRFVQDAESVPGPESLEHLLSELGRDRTVDSILGTSRSDDVTDPMRRSAATWRSVVDDLRLQTARLAILLSDRIPLEHAKGPELPVRRQRRATATSSGKRPSTGRTDPEQNGSRE